jgi:hypothetical protein
MPKAVKRNVRFVGVHSDIKSGPFPNLVKSVNALGNLRVLG